MISQLLSNTQMSATPAKGETRPAPGDDSAIKGGFPGLLATLGRGALDPVSGESPEGDTAGDVAADGGEAAEPAIDPLALALAAGAELPAVAGTGKILPASAAELPGRGALPEKPGAAAAETLPTAGRAAGTVASEMQAGRMTGAPSPENGPSPGAAAITATTRPAVAIEIAPRPSNSAGEGGGTGVTHPSAASGLDLSAGRETGQREAGQREGSGNTRNHGDAQPAARAPAEQTAAVSAKPSAEQATFAATATAGVNGTAAGAVSGGLAPTAAAIPASGAPSIESTNPFTADKPAIETQVARELGRIVDSLASAREAFTAKAATMALDHAEFGELSLRFDQRRDGQLAVQVSAADPEAHRAIAAAVAERPAIANGGDGSPAQASTQTGGGASARAGTDRDGAGADGGAAGRERRDGGRNGQSGNDGQPARGNPSGSGRAAVYA